MAQLVGILKSLVKPFTIVDPIRLGEVLTTVETLLAVQDNKSLYAMSYFVSYFNGEVKKDPVKRAAEQKEETERHKLLSSLKGRNQEKLTTALEVSVHSSLDALVSVFQADPTLTYSLDELDGSLTALCSDPYNAGKQKIAVRSVRLFFKSISGNPKVSGLVKEHAEIVLAQLESITKQPVLKVILEKLDTVDFDELFVEAQKNPYHLVTTLGRQVLIPTLHKLFTKIPLPEQHISLSDDGTDTLDVTEMTLCVPEFPDKINTRTEIDNVYTRNAKAQYEHEEMRVKLYVGITNVPCEITGTKFDFNRRSFPRIQRDGHLNLTVTGMDVGVSINLFFPTPPAVDVLTRFSASDSLEKELQKSKVQEEEAAASSGDVPLDPMLPTVRCEEPQLFKLHGFSLEFQEDVKNAELLNAFSSRFEREICFGVSALVASQLQSIMKDACVHMTTMVRLAAVQSLRIHALLNKTK